MLSESTLHYRCALDIYFDQSITQEDWNELIRAIRQWLVQRNDVKASDNNLMVSKGQLFYNGLNWVSRSHPNLRISTLRFIGNGTEFQPEYWGVELYHSDSDYAARIWKTSITLRVMDSNKCKFIITTEYGFSSHYMDEPEPPTASVPRIVKTILQQYTVKIGNDKLSSKPIEIATQREAKNWAEHLLNPNRQTPLVFVGHNIVGQGYGYTVDPQQLAMYLQGSANVIFTKSPELQYEFNFFIEQKSFTKYQDTLKCKEGLIRVYLGLAQFPRPQSHRFFNVFDIETFNKRLLNLETVILRGLIRGKLNIQREDILSIQDIQSKIDTQHLKERINNLQEKDTQYKEIAELFDLLSNENIELRNKNVEIGKNVDNAQAEALNYLEQFEAKDGEVRGLRYQIEDTQQRYLAAVSENQSLQTKVQSLAALKTLPTCLAEVLEVISQIHNDKIIITDEARKSAEDYDSLKKIERAWEALWLMATELHTLYSRNEQNIEGIFNSKSSHIAYAKTEGKQTKGNPSLMGLRTAIWDGEEISFNSHLKYGNKSDDLLRIHFHYDRNKQKIVIWHCAGHLDNATTAKNK